MVQCIYSDLHLWFTLRGRRGKNENKVGAMETPLWREAEEEEEEDGGTEGGPQYIDTQ